MAHDTPIYDELARFSDPATPFLLTPSSTSFLVDMVKGGRQRQYHVDRRSGKITARLDGDRLYLTLKSLLASEEFADLRAFADTQRRLLETKKLEEMIEPCGIIDPDGALQKVSFDTLVKEFLPKESTDVVDVLLIDGPAGVGKTSLIERMVYERSKDSTKPPIFHITSKGRRLSNLLDAIGKTASDLDARFRTEQVPTLVRLGAMQLAIDGFDELVQPDGYGNAWGALKDLIRQIGTGGPLILAGRDTFFDQQDVQNQFGKMSNRARLRMVRLQEVEKHIAIDWLKRRGWQERELESAPVRRLFERRYTRRPFFLAQIASLGSFNDVALKSGSPQEILIDRMLDREAELLRTSLLDSKADREAIKNALIRVCMEVALDMAEREADTVTHDFLELVCEMEFTGIVDQEGVAALAQRASAMALLERSELRQESRFPHSEVQNHFLARALIQALSQGKAFSVLRAVAFGMDMVEAFADALRFRPQQEACRIINALSRILVEERFPPLLQSNIGALLLGSLSYDHAPVPQVILEHVAIGEARVYGKLVAATLVNTVVNRLDARGAELSSVAFNNCSIASLIVDETTRFGTTLPTVSILQIDKEGRLEAEHNPVLIAQWLKTHSAQLDGSSSDAFEKVRDLPLVKFYDRLCRKFMRQHLIRDSDRDEASFLLRDPNWPLLKEVLLRHGRLEEETKATSGAADVFFRVVRPETLLRPDNDPVATEIRLEVAHLAEELTA